MTSVRKKLKTLALASLALGVAFAALPAGAVGTAAGTSIANRATVAYSVGGVAQTVVQSSPTGNSTPGAAAGTDTVFVVDRIVNYTLTAVDVAQVTATPGQVGVVTTFLLTNTGNDKEGFALSALNLATASSVFGNADTTDFTNLRVAYGLDATSAYSGAAVLGNLDNLAADGARRIFVLADAPLTVANNDIANVSLTAKAAVAGTAGVTLETATAGVDTAAAVDVVINGSVAVTVGANKQSTLSASSGYKVSAASLTVQKTEAVVSDPVNGVTNPKAIPTAVVEYTLVITNNGAAAANAVAFTDALPAQVALAQNQYSATQNVSITVGGVTRFCTAEAGGIDSNGDGCVLNGATLSVNPTTPIVVTPGAANAVTIKYRVTIN